MMLAHFLRSANFLKSGNSSSLSFSWITLKNDNLCLKLKIWKFLGVKPNNRVACFAEIFSETCEFHMEKKVLLCGWIRKPLKICKQRWICCNYRCNWWTGKEDVRTPCITVRLKFSVLITLPSVSNRHFQSVNINFPNMRSLSELKRLAWSQ